MHTNDGLTLLAYGYEAEICPERGANLLRLACPALKTDALRTPLSIENMVQDNPYLWGIPILFPPNRISGASFTFQNRVYRWPMNEPDTGCFLHGTIHQTPFQVIEHTNTRATLIYQATANKPYLFFPHAFTMRVNYALTPQGIVQKILIRNDSLQDMPVSIGFHTTFRIPFVQGGDSEQVRLQLSCGREILRDAHYLPTGEMLEHYEDQEDYRTGRLIPCAHVISRHFEMADPRRMELTDAATGIRITYEAGDMYRYWMVYNGGNREFLCVEPQTWINNCPNAPFRREKTGFDVLPPGGEKTYWTALSIDKL